MDEQQEGQRQQNLAIFLEGRKWAKRPMMRRKGKRPNIWAILVFALFIADVHSSSSPPLPSDNRTQQKQTLALESSANPQNSLEELRQSAKMTNPLLFQWQKQKNARNGRKGEENGRGQSIQMANNILLPYSQYEQILLGKALAEHKSEGQQGIQQQMEMEPKEKQFSESDRPVIIQLPANLNAFSHSIQEGGRQRGQEEGEMRQQVGDLLFKTGPTHNFVAARKQLGGKAKSSPKTTIHTHSPSFGLDPQKKAPKASRGHHSPIRPQSSGGIGKWHSGGRNRPSGMESSENEGNQLEGVGGGGIYGGEMPMDFGTLKSRTPMPRPHPSSAENSLITRPASIFMPFRGKQEKEGREYLRPIRPINSGDFGQEKVFLKRIQSAGHQMPPGNEEILGQEFMDRRSAPPSSANTALAALNQIFGANPPQAPLAGSPFDLFSAGAAQSAANSPQSPQNGLISQLPNPLQILSQGSTLEQITTLARNLLQMSNGNQEIFPSLTKMMAGAASADGPASKLTSSAVSLQKSQNKAAGEKTAIFGGNGTTTLTAKEAEGIRTLFSSTTGKTAFGENNGTREEERGMRAELDQQKDGQINGSMAMLNTLPSEQRTLLEAALKNGELDPENAAQFVASETGVNKIPTNGPQSGQKRLINAESRLMEWIQQNRPRPGSNPILEPKELTNSKNAATEGANGGLAKDWLWATAAADKLPYYGRYCGSFVEQANATRHRNIAGALWALDERRLLVTKFRFLPLDNFENVSFWAGPANLTGNSADFFPSENGFYLSSLPLDSQTFNLRPIQKMESRIRKMAAISSNDDSHQKELPKMTTLAPAGPPERDFLEDEATGMEGLDNELGRKRARRNLYSELYGGNAREEGANLGQSTTTAANPTPKTTTPKNNHIHSPTIVPIHFDGNPRNFHLTLGSGEKTVSQKNNNTFGIEKLSANQIVNNVEAAEQKHPSSNFVVNSRWQSLGWHNGQQPLLLTLSEGRLVKTLNWVALWDHNLKQPPAMVLIPNGVSFQVPSIVQLRPFPSAAIGVSGVKKLQSGPIRVLDTKTIEVTEFSFRTDDTLPAWFMVGKEIMPNAKGHIVPVYDRKMRNFDCDSLREFRNETVTLRLPDPMDIKDVFWFAIFSVSRGVPLSHIYIPYNDMQLPPDLLALSTPQCIWNSSAN